MTPIKQFRNGIFDENPVFVLLLGLCPALAVSTGLRNAIGMGLAVSAVLVLSNLIISGLRRLIPENIRIAVFMLVIAGLVTAVDHFLQARAPDLSRSLGIFVPLIAVNCIILARAELFARKNGALASALDGLSMGIGFTLALVAVAFFREFLGTGSLMDVQVLPGSFPGVTLMTQPVGGFIILGCLIAAVQAIRHRKGAGGA